MKLLLIITGMSGAGKSTARSLFEDLGFTCADNMPANLIGAFVSEHKGPFAVVVDSRTPGGNPLEKVAAVTDELKGGARVETIFLDSSDRALARRYGETRRNHPLSRDGDIAVGIEKERALLSDLRAAADTVIDTSGFTPHDLRERLSALSPAGGGIKVNLTSFGFKHGNPQDADMVFDVRMLPNPNFTPELKPLDGTRREIRDFVFSGGGAARFLDKTADIIDFVIGAYGGKDKLHINVAIGCTGGRHRSVAVADALAERLKGRPAREVRVVHRDIGKI
ncbi:MAG: RNase adapter RapZ [Candidatus Dadabacteria bacterium]|nr:RNase adapter RapZ [Candidatus Dadabacteria bacterium]MCY4046490.1 RNase adapter RapZ [Candidatus Dadabacteria bacterium]